MWQRVPYVPICLDPEFHARSSNRSEVMKVRSSVTLGFVDAHIWAWIEGVAVCAQD